MRISACFVSQAEAHSLSLTKQPLSHISWINYHHKCTISYICSDYFKRKRTKERNCRAAWFKALLLMILSGMAETSCSISSPSPEKFRGLFLIFIPRLCFSWKREAKKRQWQCLQSPVDLYSVVSSVAFYLPWGSHFFFKFKQNLENDSLCTFHFFFLFFAISGGWILWLPSAKLSPMTSWCNYNDTPDPLSHGCSARLADTNTLGRQGRETKKLSVSLPPYFCQQKWCRQ